MAASALAALFRADSTRACALLGDWASNLETSSRFRSSSCFAEITNAVRNHPAVVNARLPSARLPIG
jgi:hypothetical protein